MSPETRAFLDAVRTAEDPTPEDERRVLSAVYAALATGAAVGAGLGVAKGAKWLGVSTSGLKIGGLVVGLSAAAWITATQVAPTAPPPPAVIPARSIPARASSVASVTGAPPWPNATPPIAAPRAELPRSDPPAIRAVAAASANPPSSALPSLRDEIALLSEVNAALARGDGATALKRLDEHDAAERRLLAERKAARIRALCLLGRAQEAERLARLFFREHPTSVQRTAVERSCAAHATDPR